VNVGDRQKGREQADSVFDCAPNAASVASAIRHALSPETAGIVKQARNPYEKQGTSRRIADRLKHGVKPGPKPFFDVEYRLPEAKEQRS
jgi:UDP-N-acetylglucosamine 2-epimerase (non-hydrolysing)/GDP/UDP-N,N'-diacetylbacillosamine 2-epimerase (hydrolysing)